MSEAKTRRDRGTGSIQMVSENEYYARIRYISPYDKRSHEKKKRCKSVTEAKKILRDWQRQIEDMTIVDSRTNTVEKFMTNWLVTYKQPTLKPTSYDRLELTLQKHIFPYLGKLQMGDLTADQIQRHLNSLNDMGLSFSTVKKVRDAFSACIKWGVAARRLQFNPMDAVTIPTKTGKAGKRKKDTTVKYFTESEQDLLIKYAAETYKNGQPVHKWGYVIPLLLNTGLRLGELLGLQWERDVDFKNRMLKIENSIVVVKNRDKKKATSICLLEQDSVKSAAGERKIYLNDEALDALMHLFRITGKMKYVISTKNGHPVHPSTIERLMKNVRRRAGLPDGENLGPHALRHTFASNLFRNGVDIKVISELLGHAEVGITMDVYTHIMGEQKQKALVMIGSRNGSALSAE